MDLDRLAGVTPAVDEQAVEAQVTRYLAGEVEPGEPWSIETVGQADWALSVVGEARRREQGYRDEIALWTAALHRLSAGADWLEERLAEWAIANRTERVKSFPMAHGTVATRRSKPAIDVVDEDALLVWAKEHAPEAVHTTERVNKSELGDTAAITEVIVAYEAIDKATGSVETVPLPEPRVFDGPKLDRLRARLGDGFEVRPVMDYAVLDADGNPVPGVEVRPERVTATVTPLFGNLPDVAR